ncbi:MAG: PilT/PilU family type 4a pilus ATPase [bacterium]
MEWNDILKIAISRGASDVHIRAGLRPIYRIMGTLYPYKEHPPVSAEEIQEAVGQILNEWQMQKYEQRKQIDISYGVEDQGRFRINIFQQRGVSSIACRFIPYRIQTIDDLFLPPIVKKIALEQRGLVLVTGTTGSGKSTTLAAIIHHINTHRNCHIITIEDPIEFLHRDHKCLINQREVGFDAESFASALRAALRQDPDVVLVGEMRDFETIQTGLLAAETGHLVLSTLHTLDATETVHRIITVFPSSQQQQIRRQLAGIVKGVISQRLVPRADGRGRVPAVEVMIDTAFIRQCIEDGTKTKEIRDAIAKGYTTYGMQTFDQSLMYLLEKQLITYEEALLQSSNPDDFALKVRGIYSTSDSRWEGLDARIEQEREQSGSADDTQVHIERFEK